MTGLATTPSTGWVDLAPAAKSLAGDIYRTEFVPQGLRGNAPAVLACVMAGAELGLGPMTSLQLIDVIQGRPALSPEGQRALVQRAGHRIAPKEMTGERCTMWGRRADTGDELAVTWTLEQAQRAGLAGKGAWRTYPEAMLLARATSALCRALFADVISGIGSYTAEELGHDPAHADPGDVEVVAVEAEVVAETIPEVSPGEGAECDTTPEGPPDPTSPSGGPPATPPAASVPPLEERITRSEAARLLRRMGQLPAHLQDRLRMVWTENKWPTATDGKLRHTLLTEAQLHTATMLLDSWDTDPPDVPDVEAEAEWGPSATEEAEQVLAAAGLVDEGPQP